MSDPGYPPQYPYAVQDGGAGTSTKVAVLIGAVIALLAANLFLYFRLEDVRADVAKLREASSRDVASVREAAAVSAQAQRRTVESLSDQLEVAKRQANMAAGQAKIDATKRAEELAAKLSTEQEKQKQMVAQEFSNVKANVAATETKLGETIKTETGKVDAKVDATRLDLEKTVADLKRVTGDLGITSGLVATNSSELAKLKALNDRNYFEFNLGKTKAPQRVGDITILLKRADAKKNRYTIEVVADDKTSEKKDKTINEPVQFLVAGARQPYEIIVNEVGKDKIVGYLATPKVREPRK
ncbi:MAG: hypothetical protein NTZ56_08810 [Acidobacteria bacterium]|nr:hypothetical protein [Acidobacteriota bacterium]